MCVFFLHLSSRLCPTWRLLHRHVCVQIRCSKQNKLTSSQVHHLMRLLTGIQCRLHTTNTFIAPGRKRVIQQGMVLWFKCIMLTDLKFPKIKYILYMQMNMQIFHGPSQNLFWNGFLYISSDCTTGTPRVTRLRTSKHWKAGVKSFP